MTDYEIGPCGVEWPVASIDSAALEPANRPARSDSGYRRHCGACGDPITVDGWLHVWSGRLGLPEKPYDHSPSES